MLKYKRDEVLSNLYELSKNSKQVPLLDIKAKNIEAYDFDKIKDIFCGYYRNDEKLKSFDAYYYDQNNCLAIEFKKTGHMGLLQYWNEIEIKLLDTNLLLKSIFFKNKKPSEIKKKVKAVIVYEDALNYEKGIKDIAKGFNSVKPIKGNPERKAETKIFNDEIDYKNKVYDTVEKYKEELFFDVEFIDKNDFQELYINSENYNDLTIGDEII